MKLDNIIKALQDLLKGEFVAVEIGTWTQGVHYIHILVRYCSLYHIMEITRITGDPNPQICSGHDDNFKILTDLKNKI